MEDKDLLKKISQFKNIKPGNDWKNNYRHILFSQISAGANLKIKETRFNWKVFAAEILPKEMFYQLAKPVWVMILVAAALLGSGLTSVYVSRNSKLGDSLYIAKIISEKARQAMTFNEKEKVKLNLEFAANRAKEITQVLEEANDTDMGKEDKVEQLAQNFKKEISQVRDRLVRIKRADRDTNIDQEKQDGDQAAADVQEQPAEEAPVFGANSDKKDRGVKTSEQEKDNRGDNGDNNDDQTTDTNKENDNDDGNDNDINNQTEDRAATSTAQTIKSGETASAKILEEAEKLFEEKNYDGTINKLSQVNALIEKEASGDERTAGEIRGESEGGATTTIK